MKKEIDLTVLWTIFEKAWLLIFCVVIVAAVAGGLVAKFLVEPKYSSSVSFYVNDPNNSNITYKRSSVETYIEMVNSDKVINEVLESSGLAGRYDAEEIKKMMSAASQNGTEVFYIRVSNVSPYTAFKLAEGFGNSVPSLIDEMCDGKVSVLDIPKIDTEKDSPSIIKYAALFGILGAVIVYGVLFIKTMFDMTIRSEEDIKQEFTYPIIGQIPELDIDTGSAEAGGKK